MTFVSDGRVHEMTDAQSHPIDFDYNTTVLTETVTDHSLPTNQQNATVSFDQRGNTTHVLDPLGAQSRATYNNTQSAAKDLPDTITKIKRNPDQTTTTYTTALSYDDKGEVTSTTDATGATSRITYSPDGLLVTSSDVLGNTTTNTYDEQDNLRSTTTPTRIVTSYGYDAHNNLASVTQGSALTTFSYDAFGYLETSTTPSHVRTTYHYDENSNPRDSSFTWVNPANPSQTQVITTSANFNNNDQQATSTDQYGHTSVTHYDAKGRVSDTLDVLNNTTVYLDDARDQQIRTTTPDGLVSVTVYDPEGRAIYTDDPHVPGQAEVRGTETFYDSTGRVTRTDRLDNLVLTVSTNNSVSSSQFVSAGAILSTTISTYNDLGQVTSSIDAASQPTSYQYDNAGRQIAVSNVLNQTTSSSYDAAGRLTRSTDALGHITQSVYDGDGHQTKTIFADGSFTRTTYDNQGRQSSVTDQVGRTTQYQYDVSGRLQAVILAAVLNPETSLTVSPTTHYGYDDYGNLSSILDAKGRSTQFAFDAFGHQLTRTLPLAAPAIPGETRSSGPVRRRP